MAAALDLLHEAAILIVRQATTTTPTSVYNPYSTTTSSTSMASMSSMAGMSGMPGMKGAEMSFFEKYKIYIIGAAIGLPLQIAGGWFYMRRRKAKKAAAALEKENLEYRLKELEMGLGGMKPAPKVPNYEQQNVYAGSKI